MKGQIHHFLRKKSIRIIVIYVLPFGLLLGLLNASLNQFIQWSFQSIPDIAEAPDHDLTVVLAGGRGRISQTLEMIAKGRTRRLLVIGAGPGVTSQNIIPPESWPVGVSRNLVEVENQSLSTYENALKIRELVLAENLKEITVVSSYYHCPRIRLILSRILPRWTIIHMVGVGTENFQNRPAWQHFLTFRIALWESVKLMHYWIFLPKIL